MPKPNMLLWLSDARGVYIPRDFALSFADRTKHVTGVSDEEWEILEAGPSLENEWYWDTWYEVEQNAIVTDEKNIKYTLLHDGDLWLIPEGMEYNEQTDAYEWPNEN